MLLALPLCSQVTPATHFQLPNKLRVWLLPDPTVEATAVCVYHLNGVRHDPTDIRGASYLYQLLMFDGNERLETGDHVLFVNRVGGSAGGRVNFDNSFFYQIVPAGEAKMALWLESERLHSLSLEDHRIELRKNQVYDHISRLLESNPGLRAQTWVNSVLLQGTPYETPLYGDISRIRGADISRIRDLYAGFRNPANIMLVLAGKLNVDDIKNSVNRFFQDLPTAAAARQTAYTGPETRQEFVYRNWVLPNLDRPFAVIGFRAPARSSSSFIHFEFLRYLLIDSRLSRLDRVLNHDNKLNIDISAGFTEYADANALTIQLTALRRLDLEKAKYIVGQELQNLRSNPLSSSDVRAVKAAMELDLLKSQASLVTRAWTLAEAVHLANDANWLQNRLRRLQRISPYDILRIAKKFLARENQVLLNVYAE